MVSTTKVVQTSKRLFREIEKHLGQTFAENINQLIAALIEPMVFPKHSVYVCNGPDANKNPANHNYYNINEKSSSIIWIYITNIKFDI